MASSSSSSLVEPRGRDFMKCGSCLVDGEDADADADTGLKDAAPVSHGNPLLAGYADADVRAAVSALWYDVSAACRYTEVRVGSKWMTLRPPGVGARPGDEACVEAPAGANAGARTGVAEAESGLEASVVEADVVEEALPVAIANLKTLDFFSDSAICR